MSWSRWVINAWTLTGRRESVTVRCSVSRWWWWMGLWFCLLLCLSFQRASDNGLLGQVTDGIRSGKFDKVWKWTDVFAHELTIKPRSKNLRWYWTKIRSFNARKLLLLALSFTQNMWRQVINDKCNKTLIILSRVLWKPGQVTDDLMTIYGYTLF